MKMREEHQVPLSRRAVELLRSLPREGRFVFIGPKAGAAIGKTAMARVLGSLRPSATVHGFRSSFRDWAEESTAYAPIVMELALAAPGGCCAYRRRLIVERLIASD